MKTYITKSAKSAKTQKMINQALDILDSVGIPLEDKTERALERMAVCFLAVASVTDNWAKASSEKFYKTRDVISYVNTHFEENISPGYYDDIRRKDLKLMVLAGLVVNSGEKQSAATNDPTRRYALNEPFKDLIVNYGGEAWTQKLRAFMQNRPALAELLARKRDIDRIPVTLPDGVALHFSSGEHNILQKKIIEDFLPRFGKGCSVLYIGDTAHKLLRIDEESLKKLHFFELSHDELPDIIAYASAYNWLFLIEAVHSAGPMSEIRVHELKKLLKNCTADLIFVTAFLKREDFRKWSTGIAWETEVWIADNPDHLIHFNGSKFLGPYRNNEVNIGRQMMNNR
jgi:type II restriction enzyme